MVTAAASTATAPASDLAERYLTVRRRSAELARPLSAEDAAIQTMDDVSPTKWHLAHTTWFFETFVLAKAYSDYEQHHPSYGYLFNSYYNSVGTMHPRPRRGLLSRPSLDEVYEYRAAVDGRMVELLDGIDDATAAVVRLGIEHEQQHQELLLTDIKHVLAANPLDPAYRTDLATGEPNAAGRQRWLDFDEGLRELGHDGEGF